MINANILREIVGMRNLQLLAQLSPEQIEALRRLENDRAIERILGEIQAKADAREQARQTEWERIQRRAGLL